MNFSGRETKRFSGNVDPGETVTEEVKLDYDATVEQVAVRFYAGPQLELNVFPYRRSGRNEGNRTGLVRLIGEQSIAGDNDYFIFHVSEPVAEGDKLGVEIENTAEPVDGRNLTYTYTVDMEVDGAGGVGRVFSAILEPIKGLIP